MKKFLAALLILTAAALPASAENWVALHTSESAEIDTDSYVDSGIRASVNIKLLLNNEPVMSTMEFDKNRQAYRISTVKLLSAKGDVEAVQNYPDSPNSWNALLPNSFGRSVYTHFVANPIPHFANPQWMTVYKEAGIKFNGSTYDIEKNTISYKNGYATFYLRIAYPWQEQDFSKVIYQVRMDVPNKRVQTLSMTEYDLSGKIRKHGAASNERSAITPDTPMEKVHSYIKGEVDAGRLK